MESNPDPSSRLINIDKKEKVKADQVGEAWQDLCKSSKATAPEITVARLQKLAEAAIEMAVFLEINRLGRVPSLVAKYNKDGD